MLATLRFLVLALPLTLTACVEEAAEKKEAEATEPEPDGCDKSEAALTDCATDGEQTPAEGLGLADICTFAAGDAGEGCFTCTPRELPSKQCVAVSADFDPAIMCNHDLDRLSCDTGGASEFVFEFGDRSPLEDIYEKVDLLSFGAKALVYDKLASKPEMRAAIFSLVDAIVENKLALFTGGDVAPLVTKATALAKVVKPAATEAELTLLDSGIRAGAKSFSDKIKAKPNGAIGFEDVSAIVLDVLAALPPGTVKTSLDGLDLGQLNTALKGGGGTEIIGDLLKNIGGGKSLAELLAEVMGSGAD